MCGQVEEKMRIDEGNVCLWGFALHLNGGQQNVILSRMRGRRGLCLQICCVGMMGLSLWEDSLGAWFTVGPRPRSRRAAVRFLGAGFLNVESVEQCMKAVKGYGLVAQRTEWTRRDLTSKVSPEVLVATKMMCIIDRTWDSLRFVNLI
jgi:hypothetical protein